MHRIDRYGDTAELDHVRLASIKNLSPPQQNLSRDEATVLSSVTVVRGQGGGCAVCFDQLKRPHRFVEIGLFFLGGLLQVQQDTGT